MFKFLIHQFPQDFTWFRPSVINQHNTENHTKQLTNRYFSPVLSLLHTWGKRSTNGPMRRYSPLFPRLGGHIWFWGEFRLARRWTKYQTCLMRHEAVGSQLKPLVSCSPAQLRLVHRNLNLHIVVGKNSLMDENKADERKHGIKVIKTFLQMMCFVSNRNITMGGPANWSLSAGEALKRTITWNGLRAALLTSQF